MTPCATVRARSYHLVPAVCLYSASKHSLLSVRLNFKGPFKFPLPGFEAYGADWPM